MRFLLLFTLLMLQHTQFYAQSANVFDIARKGTLMEITASYNKNPEIINTLNENGSSPMILSAYVGNRDVALFLADKIKDINYNSGRGTAIMAAVMGSDIEIIKKLLSLHANPDLTDQEGKTALMYAVYFNKNEIASLLIKAGADKKTKDIEGRTALDLANFNKNTQLIILLDQ
ncbi:MAG: ankyrin repeat domain-containing protein [Flavobacterium sp.]|nr:ankyrin repeat domain-containing protein [Flavobacterium sp.]